MPAMLVLPLVLYLAAIFVISFGASSGSQALVYLGFAAIVLASVVTPLRRFLAAG